MIGALTFCAPWRPVALQAFGLVNTGWPRHRMGRRRGLGGRQVAGTDRVFCKPVAAEPHPAQQAVKVTVAQMTLAPRFELLCQNFNKAAAAIHAHQYNTTETSLLFEAKERSAQQSSESLIARIERVFLSRLTDLSSPSDAENNAAPESDRTATRVFAPGTYHTLRPSLQADMDNPRRTLSKASGPMGAAHHRAPFRGGQMHFATQNLQRKAESAPERATAIRSTTVARRVYRVLSSQDITETPTARPPQADDLQFSATGAHRPAAHAEPTSYDAPVRISAGMPPDKTERRFRSAPKPAPEAAPPAKSTLPQPSPEVDVTKLEHVMWQRFEKRLRIEQERRGRT